MKMEMVQMCCVCGLPASVVNLVRVSWTRNRNERIEDDTSKLIVIKQWPKDNDVLLCTKCISDIQELTIRDIEEAIRVTE